jgi:hypothetical protein
MVTQVEKCLGPRGFKWHTVPARRSACTLLQGSEGLLSTGVDWQGRAYDLATSFARLYSRGLGGGGGYIKVAVCVPPLVTILPELAARVRDAVAAVTFDLLNNVWTETGQRCICRAPH